MIDAHEFDIGCLINKDDIFNLARKKLNPMQTLNPKLQKLIQIMIDWGNQVEDIIAVDKEMGIYAMELSNLVDQWIIKSKVKID